MGAGLCTKSRTYIAEQRAPETGQEKSNKSGSNILAYYIGFFSGNLAGED